LVPVQEIRENNYDLSINRYKEAVYDQKEYEKPEVIIAQIEQLDHERHAIQQDLKKMLAKGYSTEINTKG
jgi:type I restriction enzyme M protein